MRTIRQPKRWLWLVGLGLLLIAAWPVLAGSFRPGQGGIRVYLPLLSRPLDVPPLSWDPRLTERGAVVIPATVAPGQGYWRLVRAQWYAENEEPFAGQHHILMDTLDRDGQRQPGAPIAVYAIVGPTYITKVTTEAKPGEPYAANFPMYEVAPFYRVEPSDGAPADAVSGLGMGSLEYPDWKIHTSYGLVWQWTLAPAATATPTPSATPSATASPVGTETDTATVTATATSTAEPSSTPTATPSVTASPVEPSATPVLTATTTETPTPTPSPSATATPTDTIAPTATPAATETPTPTPSPSATATPTRWPQVTLAPRLNGADNPVQVTHAGDGSGRLFVVEQTGRIRIYRDGAFRPTAFLDVSGRITCCGERGLLGLAFPPDYAASGRFYVNYTNLAGNTVVARYRVGSSPDMADAASEQIVLTVPQPYSNHNGGQVAFGPDGYLYIGMGDGGSAGDPGNRAQNPAELLGKLLRIDVTTGNPATYTIPPSNPFTQTAGYRGEIWAVGLRNPWRFAFDRLTGALYIGDVGQNIYEEINFQPAGSPGGQNYGWRIMEGAHCYNAATCATAGLALPVWEYDHGQGCSVTGGIVYRGADYAAMQGTYFYADYCQGKIWGLRRAGTAWRNVLLFDAPFPIATFGEDEAGRLYVADYSGGVIYEIVDGVP